MDSFWCMIYDEDLESGVRKQSIHPPRVVDFDECASYKDIVKKGQEIFFGNLSYDHHHCCLAGTSGVHMGLNYEVEWTLHGFMLNHGFVPSKFRLYVVLKKVNNALIIMLP